MSSKIDGTRDTASGSMGGSDDDSSTDNNSSVRESPAPVHEQASSWFREFLDEQTRAHNDFIKRFEEARQKIEGYSKAYMSIEKTMDRLSNLQLLVSDKDTELQKRNKEIEDLNLVRRTIEKDRLRQYDEWKKQLEERKAMIERLELKLKEANARRETAESNETILKEKLAQLKDAEERASQVEEKLQEREERCKELERQLGDTTSRLREWEKYIAVLEDIDMVSL